MGIFIDTTGDIFGRLTVLKKSDDITTLRHTCYLCECSCGKWTIVDVSKLRNGHTQSCGCRAIEESKKKLEKMRIGNIKYPKMNSADWKFYNSSIRTKTSKYKTTENAIREMMDNQMGCCPICEGSLDCLSDGYHIDHCHTTGKVRGLLCGQCNMGLGIFNDSVYNLSNAIKYIRRNYENK